MQIGEISKENAKKTSKNCDFQIRNVVGGAECHFRYFCFEVEARSEIPAYK